MVRHKSSSPITSTISDMGYLPSPEYTTKQRPGLRSSQAWWKPRSSLRNSRIVSRPGLHVDPNIRDFATKFALASHNLAPFSGSDAAGRTDFRCIRWRYIPVALPAASAQHR